MEIDRQVEDNYAPKGITRESVSPWSSPVFLVKKKDHSNCSRFCVDLRKDYAVTTKDSLPTALVFDTLDALIGNK